MLPLCEPLSINAQHMHIAPNMKY